MSQQGDVLASSSRNGGLQTSQLTVPRPLPIIRTVIDFTLLLSICLLDLVTRFFEPVQRGFFCDDQSIRYPYLSSTMSAKALFIYMLLLPAVVIAVVELLRSIFPHNQHGLYSVYEFGRGKSSQIGIRFVIFYGYALVAISLVYFAALVAKFSVGRLRPHFLAVCRPTNVDLSTCDGLHNVYITDVQCDWQTPGAQVESRLSFFSGHASLSMCSALYCVIYLQFRAWPLFRPWASRVPLAILQLLIFSTACFIGYSRIFDYWHHWSDVMCGFIVGGAFSFIVARYLGNFCLSDVPNVSAAGKRRASGDDGIVQTEISEGHINAQFV